MNATVQTPLWQSAKSATQKAWDILHDPAEELMYWLWIGFWVLVATGFIMIGGNFGLGVPGAAWLNAAILIGVTFLLLSKAFRPKTVSWVVIFGAVIGAFRDTDKSQEGIKTVPIYAFAIGYVLMSYIHVVVACSILPFREMPWAVPLLIIGAIGSTVAGIMIGGEKTYIKWSLRINLAVLLGTIALGLLMIFVAKAEANIGTYNAGTQQTQAAQPPKYVKLEACADGWSDWIYPADYGQYKTFKWYWPEVRAEIGHDGNEFGHNTGDEHIADGARFCAVEARHVNKKMPLSWH